MQYLRHDLQRERDDFIVDRLLKRGASGIKSSDSLGQDRKILLALRVQISPAFFQTSLIFRQPINSFARAIIPKCLKRHTLQPYRAGPYSGMFQDRLVGAQPMEFQ